jgi:hypothetical protein
LFQYDGISTDMAKHWRIAVIGTVILALAAMQRIAVFADEPAVTPTLVPPTTDLGDDGAFPDAPVGETTALTPTAQITATVSPTTDLGDEPPPSDLVEDPMAGVPVGGLQERTTALTPTVQITATSSANTDLEPTPTFTPVVDQLSVLVDEVIVPVGGQATSQVFVALVDSEGAVVSFEIHLLFDPEVVQVATEEPLAVQTANSVQIEAVDNDEGRIVLVLPERDEALFHPAPAWDRIATITWMGLTEGQSTIVVGEETQFGTVDGGTRAAGRSYDGVVLVRLPGSIQGQVILQGRETFEDISVSGSLSSTRFDREATNAEGRFTLTTSHGEGFYTVMVAMPGYLSAQSDRPVKVTVDSVVDIGEVTLYGGDVNGDNQIDIRDLAYVAWHFEEYDVKADINQDGQVDILDLTLTAGNFGKVGPTVWAVSVTEIE